MSFDKNTLSKREKMVLSGKVFERTVASYLYGTVKCSILLNREFLSPRLNKAIECDLIIITPSKIYCVECKNYNGYIAGKMFDKEWRFASSRKIGRVQNPYLLNRKRIRVIRGAFYARGLEPPEIESVIVVPDKCKIHTEHECNVLHLSSLVDSVIRDDKFCNKVFNVDGFERFLSKISNIREV